MQHWVAIAGRRLLRLSGLVTLVDVARFTLLGFSGSDPPGRVQGLDWLRWLGLTARQIGPRMLPSGAELVHWEAGAPAAVGVPRFLGLTGGGPHHAVAKAFVGPRTRVTYVMLRPTHPSAAAFRWPAPGVGEGSGSPTCSLLSPLACNCPACADGRCGRPGEVEVDVVDIDTFLAPEVLPVGLRPLLLGRVQRCLLRTCHCLLMCDPDSSLASAGAGLHLSSLLSIPIVGPRLRVAILNGDLCRPLSPTAPSDDLEEVD